MISERARLQLLDWIVPRELNCSKPLKDRKKYVYLNNRSNLVLSQQNRRLNGNTKSPKRQLSRTFPLVGEPQLMNGGRYSKQSWFYNCLSFCIPCASLPKLDVDEDIDAANKVSKAPRSSKPFWWKLISLLILSRSVVNRWSTFSDCPITGP